MKLLDSQEFLQIKQSVVSMRPVAPPKVGDDSIGWKQCRYIEASNRRLERTPLMRQVIHQGHARRRPGTPPAHLRSIDFGSLVTYGRPTVAAKTHFKALIQVKKGIWNELKQKV